MLYTGLFCLLVRFVFVDLVQVLFLLVFVPDSCAGFVFVTVLAITFVFGFAVLFAFSSTNVIYARCLSICCHR